MNFKCITPSEEQHGEFRLSTIVEILYVFTPYPFEWVTKRTSTKVEIVYVFTPGACHRVGEHLIYDSRNFICTYNFRRGNNANNTSTIVEILYVLTTGLGLCRKS